MGVNGKKLLELDYYLNPNSNDNIYIFDNILKKSKRTSLNALQSYFTSNSGTQVFSGNYNDLTNKPVLFTPSTLTSDYGISLHQVAVSGDYADLINKPNFTLSTILSNGFYTGSNSISINNNQTIKATNGNSFLNLREDNTDSYARLHGHETLYLTANFHKKIMIGANTHPINDTKPVWAGANSVYQQVQISGVNLRGNISLGTGLNSNGAIIGIGTEYKEVRWGNLFIAPIDTTYGGTSFRTGSRFLFKDVYNNDMFRIQRGGDGYNQSHTITCNHTTVLTTNAHNVTSNYAGRLVLRHNYFSKGVGTSGGVNVIKDFQITQRRMTFNNVDYVGKAIIDYNGKSHIQLQENGAVVISNNISSAQQFNSRLTVYGNASLVGVLSIGGASVIGNTINAPAGWRLNFNNQTTFGDNVARGTTYLRLRDSKLEYRIGTNTRVFSTLHQNSSGVIINSFNPQPVTSSIGDVRRSTTIYLGATYYNVSTSVPNETSVELISSVSPNVDGHKTKLSIDVESNTIITMNENGTISLPNIPTSVIGLLSGQWYDNNGILTKVP